MRFFFYGTLIAGGGNPAAVLVTRRMRGLGPAVAAGTLYAIPDPGGWYPALLPGQAAVHGMVYAAREDFAGADLAALDAYEDFDPAAPATSLYLRRPIALAGQAGEADAYLFNQPLPPDAEVIADGDFRAWLARTGRRAYGA